MSEWTKYMHQIVIKVGLAIATVVVRRHIAKRVFSSDATRFRCPGCDTRLPERMPMQCQACREFMCDRCLEKAARQKRCPFCHEDPLPDL